MSDHRGVLDLQVESILERLRKQQEDRCRDLLRHAETRARDLLRDKRRELSTRRREALVEERRRREKALQQARHRIRAAEGLRVEALHAELLEKAWPQLIAELERRWSEPASREAWCQSVLDEAAHALDDAQWTVEHPEDWSDRDARRLASAVRARGLPSPAYRADPTATAGLRIRCGTACLDGTIEGLLARRRVVEGRLLAALRTSHTAGVASTA